MEQLGVCSMWVGVLLQTQIGLIRASVQIQIKYLSLLYKFSTMYHVNLRNVISVTSFLSHVMWYAVHLINIAWLESALLNFMYTTSDSFNILRGS